MAWEPLGWKPVFYSEIDRFPSAVLAHRFPNVPNLGDMNEFRSWPDADFDLLVGGTPCQSFSVAGLRGGLADPRGNLALVYLALADRYRPRWIVWENVPGVLSSNRGRDFGAFLGALAALGYGWAYRILDAQYFGLAQRRKRVFVVGYLGDWRRAAAVLFESQSLRRDSPPSRASGKEVAGTLASRTAGGGGLGTDFDCDGGIVAGEISLCLNAGGMGRLDSETETFVVFDPTQVTSKANRSNPLPGAPCHTLSSTGAVPAIAFNARQDPVYSTKLTGALDSDGGSQALFCDVYNGTVSDGSSPTLTEASGVGNQTGPRVLLESSVRRLTPLECERLQGFPENFTLIPYNEKPANDGPRYRALGNSMAVPVVGWIGSRINRFPR